MDDFRTLIDPKHDPKPERDAAGSVLADYRRRLMQAAKDLPSLGEVARVLLMSEWSSAELDIDSPVPLDQVRKAVRQADDSTFQRDVQRLMNLPAARDDPYGTMRAIVAAIKREVRLQMLDRLENRTRFFLNQGRPADRIAAANLISDTMLTSRRQDISLWQGVPGVMATTPKDITPSSRYLRERLRDLSDDLEKLTTDPNPQVRVAGIRALSDLEKDPAVLIALLKPMLMSGQSDELTRRAAAGALGHVLETYTAQMDKTRPEHYLKGMGLVLAAAAGGLADSDAWVRRASLEACQRAALVLDDLASDPLNQTERRAVFRPALAVVDAILPKINAVARDRVPELRVGACHVVETLALAMRRLQYRGQAPLPGPSKQPQKYKSKASARPSQWATARAEQRPSPSAPAVALERPIKLLPERGASAPREKAQGADAPRSGEAPPLQRTVFLAPQPDELPAPAPVESGVQETVQTMIANLKHRDYRVRLAAVDALETLGDRAEAAIPALARALRDPNKFVRWSSARTLGRLAPRQADEVVPGLVRMLDDREDPGVRIAAAYALELYGEHARKAVPELARVINRGDKEYIIAILHTIQGIGTDAAPALPNVAWILSDRSQPPSVRKEAAQTLGRFGALAKEQLPILRDVMINDADEDVRNAASTAVLAVDRPLK